MNILMRGDCTSRRSVFYNRDLFSSSAKVHQFQKSPFILFNDHIKGVASPRVEVTSHVDTERMPAVLRNYFIGQFERGIFDLDSAEMLVVDSYADMNFELYSTKTDGGKFWVHKGYIKDIAKFNSQFDFLGRRTLEQSVEDAIEFIRNIRTRYGNIPVLFLNQQVEHYPKLHGRLEYYNLGRLVAQQVPNCEYGGYLQREDLELADIGSCGPGLTLHYTGETYRKMLMQVAMLRAEHTLIESKLGVPSAYASVVRSSPSRVDGDNSLSISLTSLRSKPAYSRDQIFQKFKNYFVISDGDNYEPKFLPAIIELTDCSELAAWRSRTTARVSDQVFRDRQVSLQSGHEVVIFDRDSYSLDISEIDGKEGLEQPVTLVRSKRRDIVAARLPVNSDYWTLNFGAFDSCLGHPGSRETSERQLIAYIGLRRIGELLMYVQFGARKSHIDSGALSHIHLHIIEWISGAGKQFTTNAKVLMFSTANTTNEFQRNWKSLAGFEGRKINLENY